MSKVYFISDNHFCHRNIIKYCKRPWHTVDSNNNIIITDNDVENMNESMIESWNSIVNKNDIVFNLGDFCFCNKSLSIEDKIVHNKKYFDRLNGIKYLLIGNHDIYDLKFHYSVGWKKVYDLPILWENEFLLTHRPIHSKCKINLIDSKLYNIYGHVHNNNYDITQNGERVDINHFTPNSCCVCVELWNYRPVSIEEIKDKINYVKQ